MEAILLAIYAFFVWLIFIKLKWLPWNTTSQVIVVIIPIVGLAALILLLNIFAPSSSDVRVYKYTIPIVSQARGRVIEVPVEEGNRLVKKSDVLFRIDPTPYQLTVDQLQAQIVNAEASQREQDESLKGAKAKVVESRGAIAQATSRVREVAAQLERDKELFLAAGAAGDAAIYTQHLAMIHIIRMVILRVGSYVNYLIPKLH